MDINILKTFVAVCEHSGFSAAAEKLGYTQSTVSSQIKMLEKELQTVLFDRYYHRISLTSDGIVVLGYARNILNAHEKMLTDINGCGQIDGDIRLAIQVRSLTGTSAGSILDSEDNTRESDLRLQNAAPRRCLTCLGKMKRTWYSHSIRIYMSQSLRYVRKEWRGHISWHRQKIVLRIYST